MGADFHWRWRRCWPFVAFLATIRSEYTNSGPETELDHEVADMQARAARVNVSGCLEGLSARHLDGKMRESPSTAKFVVDVGSRE